MSIIKHPVIIALFTAAIVFVVTYYYYNCDNKTETCDEKKSKNSKQKNKKKNKTHVEVNETIVVSSAIAGLVAWYIATVYFTEKTEDGTKSGSETDGKNKEGIPQGTSGKVPNLDTTKGVNLDKMTDSGLNRLKGGQKNTIDKIPHIDSDDPTRSYNLIGSGLDIPRSELKIPNVLIDYH
jgi:Ca2+/Na+ antiporter